MSTLYFSKYCRTCTKVLQILTQHQLFDIFDYVVCVDNATGNGVAENLPEYVTCVPFIKTNEDPYDLVDDNVFQWINYKAQAKQAAAQKETLNNVGPMPPPMIAASSDSNQHAKKETMEQFEKMQRLRDMDTALFTSQNIDNAVHNL